MSIPLIYGARIANVDLVGDAIRALRIGQPRSARAYLYGNWGLRWDPSRGAGFNIHVVLQGNCWLRPDGRDPVQLEAGDVAFISRTIAHGVSDSPLSPLRDVPPDENDFWFPDHADAEASPTLPLTVLMGGSYYLQRQRMHPLIESLPEVIVLPNRTQADDPILDIVNLLGAEHDNHEPGSSAAMPALLDLLLTYVIRAAFDAADPGMGWAAAIRDPALSTALHNMQNTPEIDWTVSTLARASGLSRATFARRFTAAVGQPPMAYLTWWRMNLAKQHLSESDMPLSAVASRTAYRSEFAFSKAFKREVGCSPGAFRREATARRRR
ncbi:AraC family transcriptional regulator [Mycolicibacterium hodleri]